MAANGGGYCERQEREVVFHGSGCLGFEIGEFGGLMEVFVEGFVFGHVYRDVLKKICQVL